MEVKPSSSKPLPSRPRRPRNFVAHHLVATNYFRGVDLYSDDDHSVAVNITINRGVWRAHINTPQLQPSKYNMRHELRHVGQVIADIRHGAASGSLIGTTTTDLCTSSWAVQEVRNG